METREIKFRLYDKKLNKFNYLTFDNILQNIEIFSKHLIDGSKFQQFTGQHDCEGKEIYEGDILSNNMINPILYKTYFDKFLTGFYCEKIKGPKNFGLERCRIQVNFRIIGNVSENPNLFK